MSKRGREYAKRAHNIIVRNGSKGGGGISFQFPPGWDDGSGKVKHVESGPFKGRVYFTNRNEARDLAKRYEDRAGQVCRYDPD